ncbi:MAG: hypothetical protein GXP47_09625 [Acidobacteria bacterium]|nr:hypothetical protein [Acidobacteriota bacterium]
MRLLRRPVTVWTLALLVTLTLAVFQRMTGPTHPRRGTVRVAASDLGFRLPRSHGGAGGMAVSIDLHKVPGASAVLQWRLYPGEHPWHELPMTPDGEDLTAEIPHQPPAGKVEYRILLEAGGSSVQVPPRGPVVARFKGAVPLAVLVPHILCMFLSMLLATHAFIRVVVGGPAPRATVLLGMLFLMAGGLLLGPMVQHHAFGAYWTGWPYGTDLTDNKTAIAFLAWLPATILALRRRRMGPAVLAGWVVMMGVFLIPHSLRGSQIDWDSKKAPPASVPAPRESGMLAPGWSTRVTKAPSARAVHQVASRRAEKVAPGSASAGSGKPGGPAAR